MGAPVRPSPHLRLLAGAGMEKRIGKLAAPAIGDVRSMGEGDVIWLGADARERKDWGRYQEAMAQAISRGADIRWVR